MSCTGYDALTWIGVGLLAAGAFLTLAQIGAWLIRRVFPPETQQPAAPATTRRVRAGELAAPAAPSPGSIAHLDRYLSTGRRAYIAEKARLAATEDYYSRGRKTANPHARHTPEFACYQIEYAATREALDQPSAEVPR